MRKTKIALALSFRVNISLSSGGPPLVARREECVGERRIAKRWLAG